MSRHPGILVAWVLAASLLLCGCSRPAPAPQPGLGGPGAPPPAGVTSPPPDAAPATGPVGPETPGWKRLADAPARAVTSPDGEVLLVPWIGPGEPPGLDRLDAPRRLTPEGETTVAPGAAYRLLSAEGQPAALVLVVTSAAAGKRCAAVLWSATGPRGCAVSADGARVAYTDRSNDSLYTYEAASDTVLDCPAGDAAEFLEQVRSAAPEGWSFQWVNSPRWLEGSNPVVFGSNRHDPDFSNGLSLWAVAPGEPPRRLWAAGDFGSGDHLEYCGRSVAGHLVYEARARRVLAAAEPGGPLTPLVESVHPIALSPDGRWLAVQPDNAGALEPRLRLVDLADPAKPPFDVDTGRFRFNDVAVWSPSSRGLAFLAPDTSAPGGLAQLVVVDVAAGKPDIGLHGQPRPFDGMCPPSWAGDDGVVVVSADGSTWLVDLQGEGGAGGR